MKCRQVGIDGLSHYLVTWKFALSERMNKGNKLLPRTCARNLFDQQPHITTNQVYHEMKVKSLSRRGRVWRGVGTGSFPSARGHSGSTPNCSTHAHLYIKNTGLSDSGSP